MVGEITENIVKMPGEEEAGKGSKEETAGEKPRDYLRLQGLRKTRRQISGVGFGSQKEQEGTEGSRGKVKTWWVLYTHMEYQ